MTRAALAVYVGRFQPLHAGHLRAMLDALDRHWRLLVLLGSANLARSARNPFTPRERAGMIRAALRDAGVPARRVTLRPLPDEFDADRWAAYVRQAARDVAGDTLVSLTGFDKDASSRYLHWFPDWTLDPSRPLRVGEGVLNATDLRRALFELGEVPALLPPAVAAALTRFQDTGTYTRLRAEWFALQAELAAWDGTPRHERLDLHLSRGPTGPHVWLARRPGPVGSGLWTLPATALGSRALPAGAAVFPHPARSLGVPTTAHVVRTATPPSGTRPVPLAHALARPRQFFEDHHVILRRLTPPT
ncbi:adenylyltransferase/cytidyltransferase family protein [Deinococcus radiotolerans]|uniref:Bifunctional nicotinamide mononucleotide adenylyltransferase/ADP-ribose pyrophosphatase n=1 Tax=Deinococcus radiotolerans TaxID=1309407 RepID=A0ABQ2FGS7_9DEIO|nr:adenylyltransferase/cytidyltransferase family protein [Deinococcus radiotolerans]GGK93012.1 bifunctional nicotinamide mononucleotide adenylyltransferase/ADP-ribose pyrophosphatase [Deinococcus radiotolerans]